MGKVYLACFTRAGAVTARRIADALGTAAVPTAPQRFAAEEGLEPMASLPAWTRERFCDPQTAGVVFVGATGIAVRAIAPLVASKLADPAVVTVDEAGRFAIALLSGHVGGANRLAETVAGATGGTAVISTATDVRGAFAVDDWACAQGLRIANPAAIKAVSGALLEGAPVAIAAGAGVSLQPPFPQGIVSADETGAAGAARARVHVGPEQPDEQDDPATLHLLTRNLTVGVGCRRGCEPDALARSVDEALLAAGFSPSAVATLATIDLKADEPAILALVHERGWELKTYTAQQLAGVSGDFASSDFVLATVGVGNVCERAACAEGASLLMGKRACEGTTVALACMTETFDFETRERTMPWES